MNRPFTLHPHASVFFEELQEASKGERKPDAPASTFLKTSAHAVHIDWYGPYESRSDSSAGARTHRIEKGLFLVTKKPWWARENKAIYFGASENRLPDNIKNEELPFELTQTHRFWIGAFEKSNQPIIPGTLSSDLTAVRAILLRCLLPKKSSIYNEQFPQDRVIVRNHWHDTQGKPCAPKGRAFADLIIYANGESDNHRAFMAYFKDRAPTTESITYLLKKQQERNWCDRITYSLAVWVIGGAFGTLLFTSYAMPKAQDTKTTLSPSPGLEELIQENNELRLALRKRATEMRQVQRRLKNISNKLSDRDDRIKILEHQLMTGRTFAQACPPTPEFSFSYTSDYVCLLTDRISSQK